MKNEKTLIEAALFAAEKHRSQRRKSLLSIPYINHPLAVCYVLVQSGISSIDVLVAALLHDTIEDTETTPDEIANLFGNDVLKIVLEVTDDKTLDDKRRKELQVLKAPQLSEGARLLKIADKISNLKDILTHPMDWSNKRKRDYFLWSKQVFEGCKGINPQLDKLFEETYNEGIEKLSYLPD
jgi:guanosine-3',5'-bis(diphosphate) 3'-pyrophosphohydrolase